MNEPLYDRSLMYRETIRETGVGEARLIRRTATGHEYACVQVSLKALKRGEGFQFVEQVTSRNVIPRRFLSHIEIGVLSAMTSGLSGFQLTDLRATIVDGGYHESDSTPGAFKDAAELAFSQAVRNADPVILEPIISLAVRAPDPTVGSVVAQLSLRRGRIKSVKPSAGEGQRPLSQGGLGKVTKVVALLPQNELRDFVSHLAEITDGAGTCSFRFSEYEELPSSLAATAFCHRCKRNILLPTTRGQPYRQCPICGTPLEPPEVAAGGVT